MDAFSSSFLYPVGSIPARLIFHYIYSGYFRYYKEYTYNERIQYSKGGAIATQKTLSKFSTAAAAQEYIYHAAAPSKWTMVLGDDGKIWVVTNREASILKKAGYTIL